MLITCVMQQARTDKRQLSGRIVHPILWCILHNNGANEWVSDFPSLIYDIGKKHKNRVIMR